MTVETIIPWRAGCPHRTAALHLIRRLWARTHPSWTVTVAEHDGPWCKAAAVMPAVARSDADTIIVADADVWVDDIDQMIGTGRWVVPHLKVHRLSELATEAVFSGVDFEDAARCGLTERPYEGVPGGGMVIVRRLDAMRIPLDLRFVGWGGEDHAWGYALTTMLGEPVRYDNPLWHLWHPPQPRQSRKIGSHQSEKLRRRYRDARNTVADMGVVVGEAVEEVERCLTVSSSS